MTHIPLELQFLKRRLIDSVAPGQVLDELQESHPQVQRSAALQRYHQALNLIDTNKVSSLSADSIRTERDKVRSKLSEANIPTIVDTEPSGTTKSVISRFTDLLTENDLLDTRRGAESESGGRGWDAPPVDEGTLSLLRNIQPASDGLSVFTDLGKHMFVHHGKGPRWFNEHPDEISREIAHHAEHDQLSSIEVPRGVTPYDQRTSSVNDSEKILVMGEPTHGMVSWHMRVFHGCPGSPADHARAHASEGENSTHEHLWRQ